MKENKVSVFASQRGRLFGHVRVLICACAGGIISVSEYFEVCWYFRVFEAKYTVMYLFCNVPSTSVRVVVAIKNGLQIQKVSGN